MRPSASRPFLLLLLALVLLPVVGAAAGAVQEPAAAAPAEQEAAPSGPRFGSPREAMSAYLEAMRGHDYERATLAFDPDDGVTEKLGVERAIQLYGVLNRTALVRVEELPGPGEARVGTRFLWQASPPGHEEIVVTVGFHEVDGGWAIDRQTLRSLPRMSGAVEGLPLVSDLLDSLPVLERWQYRLREGLPGPLVERVFVLENWQWIGLLLLLFAAVLVDRVVRVVARRLALRATRGEQVRLDPEVLLGFERPLGLLAGVLALEVLLPVLGLGGGILEVLLLATSFVATVAGVWACYCLVDVVADYLTDRSKRTANKFDDMLVPLLRRTLKLFVVVVGIVFVASRLSEDLWGVVAGLGIGSLAVGFAARDSIENLFGTFTVLLDKPFQIGDWVIVGDLEGTIELVGFRSTRIRTFYNSLITVPNRTFIASAVDNMGERRYRRIKTMLSLTYDTPPEKIEAFCEGVRQIVRAHPYTRKDYYHVYLNAFGPSSLDVLLYCFVETPEWATELREKHRLFADILRLAERLNVSFAFPTQTVHLAKPEDLEHPDRPADDRAGVRRGREVAGEVVERTLAPFSGEKPPPVRVQTRPVYGDEGEDGG